MNEQQRAELERIRDVLYPATGLEDYDEEIIGRVLKDIKALLAQDALYKMAEDAVTIGLSYNDWPKIGCVNHDCDQCKAVQEPVAWRYDLAKYRENDLRGRQWAHSVFSPTKPYIDEMVRNLTPLYTTPPAAQPAPVQPVPSIIQMLGHCPECGAKAHHFTKGNTP